MVAAATAVSHLFVVDLCFFLHSMTLLLHPFSYVFLHASRKTFSNVKVSISAQWTPPLQNQSLYPDQVARRRQAHGTQSVYPVCHAYNDFLFGFGFFFSNARHGKEIICLRMRRRPRCSWEPSTPSSSSHMRW